MRCKLVGSYDRVEIDSCVLAKTGAAPVGFSWLWN